MIVAAPVITALALVHTDTSGAEFARLAVLLGAAVAYGEAFDRIERFRRFLGDGTVRNNHLSVWTVAGILALSPGAVCLLTVLIYAHVFILGHRHKSLRPHRMLFTAGAAVLATFATAEVAAALTSLSAPWEQLHNAAAATISVPFFVVLDTAIVVVGVYLATKPASVKDVIPGRDNLTFELSVSVLGVVTGELLLFMPWLAPVACGGLVALHRASLVKHLQVAATTDAKTTLLNAAAWRDRALQSVRRAAQTRERVAVVVIDLDFFKRINDRYGHLVGDRVLSDVAQAIRNETRSADIVGRFGGEEFVVLIAGRAAAAHAIDIATRIRERIASLTHPEGMQVTATIGVAHGVPDSGDDLDTLLVHADLALYEGKEGGRDRVRALALA